MTEKNQHQKNQETLLALAETGKKLVGETGEMQDVFLVGIGTAILASLYRQEELLDGIDSRLAFPEVNTQLINAISDLGANFRNRK